MSAWPYAEGDQTPFACPNCATLSGGQALRAGQGAAACLVCGRTYPVLSGVACLVPEPERFLLQQLRNLQDYLWITAGRQREIELERSQPGLLELTRQRLLQLVRAMEAERALVSNLLAPLVAGLDAEAAGIVPGGAGPARELSVLEMYETVFRDWAWGEPESARALQLTEQLVAEASKGERPANLGRLAVFGAGACRLAADVHRTLGPVATYAVDLNPLPLLLATQLLNGATIEAYEYPTGPRGLAHTAVLQQLKCSVSLPAGLLPVLADARFPPFAPGSLDSVLTPWFIDVVSADLPETIATIHRVLKPNGLWLNQGPLRFGGSAARRYSIEEVHELVRTGGFELVAGRTDDAPYFDSPHAGSRRIETVYGFAARRLPGTPETRTVASAEPAWASDITAPIPLVPELGALQERLIFSAGALSLIDGTRSLRDLAEALGAELGVEPQRLVEPLRGLLLNLLLGA